MPSTPGTIPLRRTRQSSAQAAPLRPSRQQMLRVRATSGCTSTPCGNLAKLRLAGWIGGRRDGRRILYRVVDPHIVTLVHQAVEHILDQRAECGTGRNTVSHLIAHKA
jgi:hypothetical protein